jgi:hypothetical protein
MRPIDELISALRETVSTNGKEMIRTFLEIESGERDASPDFRNFSRAVLAQLRQHPEIG